MYFADYVKVEAKSDLLNNLILIATIVLNNDMKNEAERSLENYIEVFFMNVDEDPETLTNKPGENQVVSEDEDDLTSQYSTLSSMLGFQVRLINSETKFIQYLI